MDDLKRRKVKIRSYGPEKRLSASSLRVKNVWHWDLVTPDPIDLALDAGRFNVECNGGLCDDD
jgi:hypothetical protein